MAGQLSQALQDVHAQHSSKAAAGTQRRNDKLSKSTASSALPCPAPIHTGSMYQTLLHAHHFQVPCMPAAVQA